VQLAGQTDAHTAGRQLAGQSDARTVGQQLAGQTDARTAEQQLGDPPRMERPHLRGGARRQRQAQRGAETDQVADGGVPGGTRPGQGQPGTTWLQRQGGVEGGSLLGAGGALDPWCRRGRPGAGEHVAGLEDRDVREPAAGVAGDRREQARQQGRAQQRLRGRQRVEQPR